MLKLVYISRYVCFRSPKHPMYKKDYKVMPFNFLLDNGPFYGKPHPSHVAKHDGRHLYSPYPWEMTVG